MKKLDTQILQKLKGRLEEMPPRQHLRPYDVIAELAESISGVRSRGYDLDDLVTVLSDVGIKLTRNTVRNYLSRARKRARDSGSTDPSRPAAVVEALSQAEAVPARDLAPASTLRERARAAAQARAAELQESADGAASASAPGRFSLLPDTKDI